MVSYSINDQMSSVRRSINFRKHASHCKPLRVQLYSLTTLKVCISSLTLIQTVKHSQWLGHTYYSCRGSFVLHRARAGVTLQPQHGNRVLMQRRWSAWDRFEVSREVEVEDIQELRPCDGCSKLNVRPLKWTFFVIKSTYCVYKTELDAISVLPVGI